MAAKRGPTTQHRLTLKKPSDTLTTTHTYISKGGGSGSRNKKISQVLNRNDPLRSATLRYAITCKPLQTRRPPRMELPAWGSTAVELSRGKPWVNYNLGKFNSPRSIY